MSFAASSVLRTRGLHVVIKAFHDGSGKHDNPGSKFLTLAGFCSTESIWNDFEAQFTAQLKHHGAPEKYGHPYIHMCDATASKNGFRGWSSDKLSDLVMSLIALVPEDLIFFSCTVNLDEFKLAKPKLSSHVTQASVVCAEWCFTKLRVPESFEPIAVNLYYDRNETFLRVVDKQWRSVPKRKQRGWKREVAMVAPVNSLFVPAIQMADVAAWITNRHYSLPDRENWWLALTLSTMRNRSEQLYEYKELMKDFAPGGRLAPPV